MSDRNLILIIDDNEDDCIIISRLLEPEYQTHCISTFQDIQNTIQEYTPTCILLDYHMGAKNGVEVLKEIKQSKLGSKTPVVMITGEKNYRVVVECMKEGAIDYLVKEDYNKERIFEVIAEAVKTIEREKRIEHQQAETQKFAQTDELTGVWNRRYLLEELKRNIEANRRQTQTFSVCFFDVDKFKAVNDTYGHLAGDFLLKDIIRFIREKIRDSDFLGRYGGDEFVIVFNQNIGAYRSDILFQSCRRLDGIRQQIEHRSIELPDCNRSITISLSFGVTSFLGQSTTVAEILSEADRALYYAKQCGRNRIAYHLNGKLYLFDRKT
ncbi:MAG: diguanylate cyclase [Cyanobacteria bacterium SID2]|nr:diguanylate cyclase [Cyanobacteria bacterium SID2]MBP0002431.1 diguanylate cyclase [Cyanobacteria bacterium SBC]